MNSHYTAQEVITIITAIGILVAGLGAVVVNIIVALRTGNKIDTNIEQTAALRADVKEVHTITNTNFSKVQSELSTSNAINAELLVTIRDLKNEREKLATITATALMPGSIPVVSGLPVNAEVVESLDAIKDSTAATAKNTQKK